MVGSSTILCEVPSPNRRSHFIPGLPTLLEDIIGMTDKWVASGRIDPFIEFFDVSALLTAHILYGSRAESSVLARFPHNRPYGHLSRIHDE